MNATQTHIAHTGHVSRHHRNQRCPLCWQFGIRQPVTWEAAKAFLEPKEA